DVTQQHVGRFLADRRQRLAGSFCFAHTRAAPLEDLPDQRAGVRFATDIGIAVLSSSDTQASLTGRTRATTQSECQ
ncbi:MAG: hypothetical protein ABIQ52_20310, partial [Vicinamibacterales bacterium]